MASKRLPLILIALFLFLSAKSDGSEQVRVKDQRHREAPHKRVNTEKPQQLQIPSVPLTAFRAIQNSLSETLRTIETQAEAGVQQSLAYSETAHTLHWQKVEAFATIGAAVVTLAAVIVALFQEQFWRWYRRPILEVKASIERPDFVQIRGDRLECHANGSVTRKSAMFYYLRASVTNNGRETARYVELYAKTLNRWHDGGWNLVKEFPPMNLVWSNSPEQSYKHRVYLLLLPRRTDKHCDICHIIEPSMRSDPAFDDENNPRLELKQNEVSITFDLKVKPNNNDYIVEHGTYCLSIVVAAENATSVERYLRITVPREWQADEDTMRKSGISMEVFDTKKALIAGPRR